jgi:protein SCO1/2
MKLRPGSVRVVVASGLLLFLAMIPAPATAQLTGAATAGYKQEPGMPASEVPKPLREIGFDQNLTQPIPLDTEFRDEQGRQVRVGDYFGKRPVVLLFAYYECPMLCTQVINGIATALSVLSLEPGKDFEIVTVSFDPRDTPQSATAKKTAALNRYRHPGAAASWHFLSGDEASIRRLTQAAGFRYVWDERTRQFAHPTGVIILTPDGRLARYLFGIDFGPRDLRLALVEASAGKVGSRIDTLLLYCYHYDPMTGRYGVAIMRALRISGVATVLLIGSFIFVKVRRERRASPATHPATDAPEHRAAATAHSRT